MPETCPDGRSFPRHLIFQLSTQNILGGSLQSLIPPGDRLVKAKSDGSLASTSVSPAADSPLSKSHRSRSLEPLSGLATWSSEPQIIELVKGDRGLGFSILDYQVMNRKVERL